MSLLSIHVEETYRAWSEFRILDAELRTSLLDESAHRSCLADTGKVSLHVGHEAWHSCLTECLRKHLERYSLSCTGSAGDETMTVRHLTAD